MAKRTATKTTTKAPKIRQASRSQLRDLGATTVDTPTITDTNPVGTTKENRPPQGFEPQLPETLEQRIPTATTPSTATTSGEGRQDILDNSLGRVSRGEALKARFGMGGKKDGERLPGGNKTDDIPEFVQGFDSEPTGKDVQVKAGDIGGTPMDPFRGSSVEGPLGELASSDVQSPGTAEKGKDLISTWRQMRRAGETSGEGHVSGTGDRPDRPVRTLNPEGARKIDILRDGSATIYEKDGTVTKLPPGSVPTSPPASPKSETDEKDADTDALAGGGAGKPDPDNQGVVDVDIITGTILEQLQAAQAGRPTRQGGGGDTTPVDDGGIGGVVRDGFIAPNQGSINGRNLFGQPGGNAIGENVSGGNKGLSDFGQSNGPGTINPGPEGGDPAGDPRFAEDPGAALGDGKPGPSFPGNDDTDGSGATGNDQNQGNDPITGSKLASGGGLVIADGFQPRTLDAITAFLATQPQPAPGTVPTAKPELVLPQPQTFVSKELFSTAPLIGSVGPTEPTTRAPFSEPVLTSVFGPSPFLQARTTSTLLLA
ncbi:MAG: hypothetical protein ACOVNL_00720 [Prochlorococcaceae cyanobacterium]|jgi:hypothetical protein